MKRIYPYIILLSLTVLSCTGEPKYFSKGNSPVIYPDYTDITVPGNIAPVNFMIQDSAIKIFTIIESGDVRFKTSGQKVCIPLKKWRQLTRQGNITVTVFEQKKDGWFKMKPFDIYISDDIDPYLTYRVIPPLFETYHRLSINQRNITNFKEKVVYANTMASKGSNMQCINCHSFKNWKTDNMQFHIRQYLGGTIMYTDGKLEKLNLKTDSTISAAVYPSWHPTHNYIAYSTNRTFQNIHTNHTNRIEVFDEGSDLVLYNLDDKAVSIIENDSAEYECYPSWAPDGKTLYFVSAHVGNPSEFAKSGGAVAANANATFKYSLYSKEFNPDNRTWSAKKKVYDAAAADSSITWPRVSPDGRWMVCCISTHGVFPPNQEVSDLMVFDLEKGTYRYADEINSNKSESYHAWASNGKWMVLSSRREDGVHTRLYITHLNPDGTFTKPFLLPQKDPEFTQKFMYSFNIPEFTVEPVKVSAKVLASFIKGTDAKPVSFEQKRGE